MIYLRPPHPDARREERDDHARVELRQLVSRTAPAVQRATHVEVKEIEECVEPTVRLQAELPQKPEAVPPTAGCGR